MKELAKQYDPSQVEDRIYQFWLDGGYFHTKLPFRLTAPAQKRQHTARPYRIRSRAPAL